jgi:queuine tRNA-ribosyltransferase/7-cyano-7-deazaguanine tRNA-ribosyltransferase
MSFSFAIEKKDHDSLARFARYETPHGVIETPAFITVGTQGTVKSLTPEDLREIGAQVVLGNTYHLYLRPGAELVQELGGLHKFMGWDGPMVTDSGGFQVFSLGAAMEDGVGKIANIFPEERGGNPTRRKGTGSNHGKLVKIDEEGVTFTSHLDGSLHLLTPEKSIEIQQKLGADIILAFDECTSPLAGYEYTKKAMDRTHRWAVRCLEAVQTKKQRNQETEKREQALFGIVQGGEYEDLRKESAAFISSLPFDGYAIGGSLGKSKQDMHRVLEWTIPLLSDEKPRHLLGIGEVGDMFEAVERGIDLFDCVQPTRLGRTGELITSEGSMNIRNAMFARDHNPPDPACSCKTCAQFSRAYLHHLFRAEELLAYRLASYHNLFFVHSVMREIREAIKNGTLRELKRKFLMTNG